MYVSFSFLCLRNIFLSSFSPIFHVFVIYNNREKINKMEKEIDWQVGWDGINLDLKQNCEAICCLSFHLQLRTHRPDYITPLFVGEVLLLSSQILSWEVQKEEPYNIQRNGTDPQLKQKTVIFKGIYFIFMYLPGFLFLFCTENLVEPAIIFILFINVFLMPIHQTAGA